MRDQQVRSLVFVLPGLDAGGSEHVVSMLANQLVNEGFSVTLLAFVEAGTEPYYLHHPDVRLVGLGRPVIFGGRAGQLLSVAVKVYRLWRALNRLEPNIVLSFLTRTNVMSLLAGYRYPVIVSERNNAAAQQLGPIWSWLRRKLYSRAAALVTMTSGAMAQFERFAPSLQRVIPNHAVLPEIPAVIKKGRLVAVGRLVPQKGFDLLLEAFAAAASDHPDWSLTIWGEGPERSELESRCRQLGLEGRVSMPGLTATACGWTSDADLFVLSSRYEGWALVIGEAMAAGIPTVAFDCEFGPAEMIENGVSGVLVRNGDVVGLARELARLFVDDAERKRLGSAGRRAMERYRVPAIMSQWMNLIDCCCPPVRQERAQEVARRKFTTGSARSHVTSHCD